jgi:hypothetical protein
MIIRIKCCIYRTLFYLGHIFFVNNGMHSSFERIWMVIEHDLSNKSISPLDSINITNSSLSTGGAHVSICDFISINAHIPTIIKF